MHTLHTSPKKRKSKLWFILFLLSLAGVSTALVYRNRSFFYFHLGNNSLLQLETHTQKIEKLLLQDSAQTEDTILTFLEDARQLAKIAQKNQQIEAFIYYYQSLFDFYEMTLRIPFDEKDLIQLAGRGFLPQQTVFPNIPKISLPRLARRAAIGMRKAFALDPTFLRSDQALLVMVYGNLLYSERIKQADLNRILSVKEQNLSPFLHYYWNWMSTGLLVLMGEEKMAFQKIYQLPSFDTSSQKKNIPAKMKVSKDLLHKKEQSLQPLRLSHSSKKLLFCYTAYYAKDYIRSLRFARSVKRNVSFPLYSKIEALRMEAEIFYIQRGPLVARPYMEKAYTLSDKKDILIEERLQEPAWNRNRP